MKLTHVFGLVAAIHVAAFTVIFATPGCRSSGKTKPRPEQTEPAANAGVPVDTVANYEVPSMSDADINPAFPGSQPVGVTAVAPVAPSATADGTVRFSPSRPGVAATPTWSAPVAPEVSAPSATHTVVRGDSLWSISRKYGVTVAELAAANKLAPSATLRLEQKLVVPAKASASVASASSTAVSDAANTYEVKPGDTLGAIARKQGTTIAALRTANNLSGDMLRVGQKLVIPGNAAPLSASAAPSSAAPAPTTSAPRAGTDTHSVVSGDTLGSIARTYGVRVGEIATLNNITDPAKLRVGQVLRLPSGARAATSAPAPAAAQTVTPAPVSAPAPLTPRFDEPTPVTPINPVEPVEPAMPVTPIEPSAVPVIRIE
jgi:LysM repeat protein